MFASAVKSWPNTGIADRKGTPVLIVRSVSLFKPAMTIRLPNPAEKDVSIVRFERMGPASTVANGLTS